MPTPHICVPCSAKAAYRSTEATVLCFHELQNVLMVRDRRVQLDLRSPTPANCRPVKAERASRRDCLNSASFSNLLFKSACPLGANLLMSSYDGSAGRRASSSSTGIAPIIYAAPWGITQQDSNSAADEVLKPRLLLPHLSDFATEITKKRLPLGSLKSGPEEQSYWLSP